MPLQAQGLVEDPTILFVADAELVELRVAEEDPLVVVQFNCQQIKCTRDKWVEQFGRGAGGWLRLAPAQHPEKWLGWVAKAQHSSQAATCL